MSDAFQILTYNIHKGYSSGNLLFTLPILKKELIKLEVDFVFLQEVHGKMTDRDRQMVTEESQLEFIADVIWPHSSYGKNAVREGGHYGNAILSRLPIARWENLDMSLHKFERRGLLHVEIPFQETTIHLLNVHLNLLEFHRKKQYRMITQRIIENIPPHLPLLLCGDFNDWTENASQHFRDILNLQEAFSTLTGTYAKTFPSWFPLLKNDRIYFRNLHLLQAQVLTGEPWNRLSDHCPLFAEFRISN